MYLQFYVKIQRRQKDIYKQLIHLFNIYISLYRMDCKYVGT